MFLYKSDTNLLGECCDWQYLLIFMVEVEAVRVEDQGFRRGTGEVRQYDSASKISRVVLKISPSLNFFSTLLCYPTFLSRAWV